MSAGKKPLMQATLAFSKAHLAVSTAPPKPSLLESELAKAAAPPAVAIGVQGE